MSITPNGQKLVAALRSGEFTQGERRLTTIEPDGTERDCCLGVACKLAMADGVPIKRVVEPLDDGFRSVRYMAADPKTANDDDDAKGDTGVLIPLALNWLGFWSPNGEYGHPDADGIHINSLTSDNDRGTPFAIIADTIEANADTLFREPIVEAV